MIDPKAFTGPTATALKKGIPVLSYNADEPNGRLAYIGQDLFVSGQQMGAKIKALVPSGNVALFIATPGSANIQPRIDGAISVLKGSAVKYKVVATGAALPQELSTIESFWTGHTTYKGMFAVDGGSTQSVFQTIQKYELRAKGIKGGGYDLTPVTQQLLAAGQGDFTIDQQPYLQGFIPTLELFLYQASKHLSGIADVDTGLKFLNKTTVVPVQQHQEPLRRHQHQGRRLLATAAAAAGDVDHDRQPAPRPHHRRGARAPPRAPQTGRSAAGHCSGAS